MKWISYTLAALALLAITAPVLADEVAWPATEPGNHARAYFAAFARGEAAMRSFWLEHGSKAALAQRPVEPRLDVWREMNGEFGTLTPVRVAGGGDDLIEVVARTAHGQEVKIGFMCEKDAPHGLMALRVGDPEDAGAGGAARPMAPPPDHSPPPTDDQIVARLSHDLDSLAAAGEFSGTALLDKGGRTLYGKSFGMASREKKTPNQLDTRFNLGSINKIFTATAIQQLAVAGKLKVTDPISKWLPDYPKPAGDQITIEMLVDHRGGVPDFMQNEKLDQNPMAVRTIQGWYDVVRDLPLEFEPGTKQQYSNGGYVLLGMVITRASGEDYYDYIRGHIYRPAGMTRSDSYAVDDKVDGIASGYTRRDARPGNQRTPDGLAVLPGGHHFGRGSPAGGGYSTCPDLVKFATALREGRLKNTMDAKGAPGFGIAGGSPGVNGLLVMNGNYTLAILANIDPPAAERFARTVGGMIRRAAGEPADGERKMVRAGGGAN